MTAPDILSIVEKLERASEGVDRAKGSTLTNSIWDMTCSPANILTLCRSYRDARRDALGEAVKIAESYAEPNRFKASDTWRDEMSPSEVYNTAAIDVSSWIQSEILALISDPPPPRGEDRKPMFKCNCPHEARSGCSEPACPHYVDPQNDAKASRLLTECADFFAATLAKADPRAWRMLMTYAPAPQDDTARLREALELARDRFADLALLVRRDGSYSGVGLLQRCADRCNAVLNGGRFGDDLDAVAASPAPAKPSTTPPHSGREPVDVRAFVDQIAGLEYGREIDARGGKADAYKHAAALDRLIEKARAINTTNDQMRAFIHRIATMTPRGQSDLDLGLIIREAQGLDKEHTP